MSALGVSETKQAFTL